MSNTSKHLMNIAFSSPTGYLTAVDYLLDHIKDTEQIRNPNKYAFILLAASALEAILNDAIIWWAHDRFQRSDYKRMSTAFLSMSLRGKLDAVIHLLSDGQYISNNESPMYQQLSELVKVRNEVAHSKNFFHEAELDIEEHEDGHLWFKMPDTMMGIFSDTPLTQAFEQCSGYRNSLHELHGLIAGGSGSLNFASLQFCKKVTQQDT